MKRRTRTFWRDRSGATAIEYGLIASLISLALFAGLQRYYSALDTTYNVVITNVQDTTP